MNSQGCVQKVGDWVLRQDLRSPWRIEALVLGGRLGPARRYDPVLDQLQRPWSQACEGKDSKVASGSVRDRLGWRRGLPDRVRDFYMAHTRSELYDRVAMEVVQVMGPSYQQFRDRNAGLKPPAIVRVTAMWGSPYWRGSPPHSVHSAMTTRVAKQIGFLRGPLTRNVRNPL